MSTLEGELAFQEMFAERTVGAYGKAFVRTSLRPDWAAATEKARPSLRQRGQARQLRDEVGRLKRLVADLKRGGIANLIDPLCTRFPRFEDTQIGSCQTTDGVRRLRIYLSSPHLHHSLSHNPSQLVGIRRRRKVLELF